MAVLSAGTAARAQRFDAGRIAAAPGRLLFALGWVLVKLARILATAIAAVLFCAGWLAAAAVWSLLWCGRAVRLGWQQRGRRPIGGQRGTP